MCNKPYITANTLANINPREKREQVKAIVQSANVEQTNANQSQVVISPTR